MAFAVATVLTNAGKGIIANRIKGTGTESLYFATGTGATAAARTAAATDTALSTEYLTRSAGTSSVVTTFTTNDTYQVVGSVTANSSVTIDEYGLFNASTAGTMFVSATVTPISVISGDIVQYTTKLVF